MLGQTLNLYANNYLKHKSYLTFIIYIASSYSDEEYINEIRLNELPAEQDTIRACYDYVYRKNEIVWIIDKNRVWAGQIEENMQTFCKVFLYGNSIYNTQHVGLGLTYIYPYDYTKVEIDDKDRERICAVSSSESLTSLWASEQNQIFISSLSESTNLQPVQNDLGIKIIKFYRILRLTFFHYT